MSVETIFKIALHPFVQESVSSLRDMTSHEGRAGVPFMEAVEDFAFKGYAVHAEITGSLEGAILMHLDQTAAVEIGNDVANSMLGGSHDYAGEDAELGRALAEWGNTIVGRATDFLARHQLGFQFSAPAFAASLAEIDPLFNGVSHVVTVPIEVDGVGVYHFHLLVRGGSFESLQRARGAYSSTELAGPVHLDRTLVVENPATTPLPLNARILVVDDSALIRKAVQRFLNGLGYINLVEVSDGSDAVAAVKAGGIDFVIMDMVMETMNGDEALRYMRAINPGLPVVMLSSVTDQTVIQGFQQLGISGFIFKPLNRDNGPAVLRSVLKI